MTSAPNTADSNVRADQPDQALSAPEQARRNRSLAFGTLGGAVLWGLQIAIGYALVPKACETGSKLGLYVLAAVAGILTIAAGVLAWQQWRIATHTRAMDLDEPQTDRAFLGSVGALASLLFFFIILATGLAAIFLSPCPLLTMIVP